MGRDTKPSCKQCRREGMKLFLKGARCNMAKCPIETGRPSPGMHGQRRGKKSSDYGFQLREKQRLRRQYGLREKQFRRFFGTAVKTRGITGEKLLQMLEMRLDNLVFKFGWATSRKAARIMVTHGHVNVGGRRVNIPSMIVPAGSSLQVRNNVKSRAMASRSREITAGREMPVWLSLDDKNFTGQLIRVPTRDEIAPVVNEQLIVELYSK